MSEFEVGDAVRGKGHADPLGIVRGASGGYVWVQRGDALAPATYDASRLEKVPPPPLVDPERVYYLDSGSVIRPCKNPDLHRGFHSTHFTIPATEPWHG